MQEKLNTMEAMERGLQEEPLKYGILMLSSQLSQQAAPIRTNPMHAHHVIKKEHINSIGDTKIVKLNPTDCKIREYS